MARNVLNSRFSFARNIIFNRKYSLPKLATSASRKTLPAMLGRPHRTTRFDRLTTDICRKRGMLKTEKSKHKQKKQF